MMIDASLIAKLSKVAAAVADATRKRLTTMLDPGFWHRYATAWRERQLHGGVAAADRTGYVLAAADMRGLAPGLFAPAYYLSNAKALPAPTKFEVGRFLTGLIARSTNTQCADDVATAIKVATKRIGKDAFGVTFDQHTDDLVGIGAAQADLYDALMRGNFPTAGEIVEAIDDAAARAHLVRVAARQRIIWSAADLHRVAARGAAAAEHHIAWFLRPLVDTRTVNSVLKALLALARADERLDANMALTRKVDAAATRIRIHGPRGPVLTAVEPAAKLIEAALKTEERQALLAARPDFRAAMKTQAATVEAILADPERSDQETVHQFLHAGLSEVATLFVTAYRVAEDEAAMLAVVADLMDVGAVWNVERRVWPTSLNAALAARARHFVAAYRPAILRDLMATSYNPATVRLGEVSETDGAAFMIRVAGQASATDQKVAEILDLSHVCRSRSFST